MSGRLTTHVLDMTSGAPARDLALRLYAHKGESRSLIIATRTNADGRCDAPLLDGDQMRTGEYELEFDVGEYFAQVGLNLAEIPFLRIVPIRFGLSEPSAHYHVPLMLSPFGYSTYRGS